MCISRFRFRISHLPLAKIYRTRYWNDAYFNAVSSIDSIAKKHNLTMGEVALRWITNHSELRKEHGDAILIGASSLKHIEENLVDLEKGPLPDEVLKVLDEAWISVKPFAAPYHH